MGVAEQKIALVNCSFADEMEKNVKNLFYCIPISLYVPYFSILEFITEKNMFKLKDAILYLISLNFKTQIVIL